MKASEVLQVALATSVLLMSAGCGQGERLRNDISGGAKLAAAEASERQIVAERINQFGLDLFNKVRKGDGNGNVLISPTSISLALAEAYGGAAGETAAGMARTLHIDQGIVSVHAGFGDLSRLLAAEPSASGYELSIANKLFGQEGFTFKSDFLSLTQHFYGSAFGTLDFLGNPDGARNVINAWVEERTHHKIKELMPPGSIQSNTRLALVNAVYFKAEWKEKFYQSGTRPGAFLVSVNKQVETPFMNGRAHVRMVKDEALGVTAVELPYAHKEQSASHASMVLVLPDDIEGLKAVEDKLTAGTLHDLTARLDEQTPQLTQLSIPKWTFYSESMKLNEPLMALGMGEAFNPGVADFSGMAELIAGERLYISHVSHKTFIGVTEGGTEAAGATGVSIGITSAPSSVFRADRPFLYLIRDDTTGAILFLGHVRLPTV